MPSEELPGGSGVDVVSWRSFRLVAKEPPMSDRCRKDMRMSVVSKMAAGVGVVLLATATVSPSPV
jgi:hypothetical protein